MTPEFESVLFWGGSPQAQCSCGRVHYTSGGDFMDEGELDGLNTKHAEAPDRYIPTSDDCVSVTDVNGVPYVWACPCGALDRIESLFWRHRSEIIRYYRARTQRELEEAANNASELAGLPDFS